MLLYGLVWWFVACDLGVVGCLSYVADFVDGLLSILFVCFGVFNLGCCDFRWFAGMLSCGGLGGFRWFAVAFVGSVVII